MQAYLPGSTVGLQADSVSGQVGELWKSGEAHSVGLIHFSGPRSGSLPRLSSIAGFNTDRVTDRETTREGALLKAAEKSVFQRPQIPQKPTARAGQEPGRLKATIAEAEIKSVFMRSRWRSNRVYPSTKLSQKLSGPPEIFTMYN